MQVRVFAALIGAVVGLVVGATAVAPRLAATLDAARVAGPDPASEALAAADPDAPTNPGAWRVASTLALPVPAVARIADSLHAELPALSKGALSALVSPPGHLVPPADTLQALSSGAIDAAILAPGDGDGSSHGAPTPLALLAGHPFGPGPVETLAWLNAGGGLAHMNALYAPFGIHAIPCGLDAAADGGWFRHPIDDAEDFRGLRLRADGFAAAVVRRLGAESAAMNSEETRLAFAAGGLDGAILPAHDPAAAESLRRNAGILYYPAWQRPSLVIVLAVNDRRWRALASETRTAIEGLCAGLATRTLSESEARQFAVLKTLTAEDVEIRPLPRAVIQALRSAWQGLVDDFAAEDPAFRTVWSDLEAFRHDYAIWDEIRSGVATD